jgi:hypothetical protein
VRPEVERGGVLARATGGAVFARLLGAAILLVGFVGPAASQVSIQVVDSDGRPIPAVRVDVFGRAELIGVESTSAQGTAELSAERWSEVRRISLSHLGFQTLILQVEDVPADGVIRLEPRAVQIEGLTVEGSPVCPIADDRDARRLWSEVASLYSASTGSRAWSAYLSRSAGSVRQDGLHRASDSRSVDYVAAGHPDVIHGGDHTPRSLDELVSTEGYAWPPLVIDGTTSGRELAWAYPRFDGEHAYHFASPLFGALHNFEVVSRSGGQTTLLFCGNGEGSGATMRGTVSLLQEEAFLAAEWLFETDDPHEGAGGSVSFTSLFDTPGVRPHLVTSDGLFYRHSGAEPPFPDLPRSYSRFGTEKVRWYIHPSADHPCNSGLTFYLDPPKASAGIRFAECVAEHWGRE